MVGFPVLREAFLIAARGGEKAGFDRERAERAVRIRVAHRDAPVRARVLLPPDADAAAHGNDRGLRAGLRIGFDRRIAGGALADAAEIHRVVEVFQRGRVLLRVEAEEFIADVRQQRVDGVDVRHLLPLAVEVPQAGDRRDRHVKGAAASLGHVLRDLEDLHRVAVKLYPVLSGGVVQLLHVAAGNAPGDLVFQRLNRVGGGHGGFLAVVAVDALLHIAAHRVRRDLIRLADAVEQRKQGDDEDEHKQHGAEDQRQPLGRLFGHVPQFHLGRSCFHGHRSFLCLPFYHKARGKSSRALYMRPETR